MRLIMKAVGTRRCTTDTIFSPYARDDFPGLFGYVLLDTLNEYLTVNPGVVLRFDANYTESDIDAFDYDSHDDIIE